MSKRKRINLGHPRNKGKYCVQMNNHTVFAPVNNIDPNEEDVLDIARSTALLICPVFKSLSLSLTGTSVRFVMFAGDTDTSEPQCCLLDNPCWDCGN